MNERLEYLKGLWVRWMDKIKYHNREADLYKDAADRIKAEIEELERAVKNEADSRS